METPCEICGKKEVYVLKWEDKSFYVCGQKCEDILAQREGDKKSPFIRKDKEVLVAPNEIDKIEKVKTDILKKKEQLASACKYGDYDSSVYASDEFKKTLLRLVDKHKKIPIIKEILEKEYSPVVNFNNELRAKEGMVRAIEQSCREKVESLKTEIQMVEMKERHEISKIVRTSSKAHLDKIEISKYEPKF